MLIIMNRGLITASVLAVLLIGAYALYRTTAQTAPTPSPVANIPAPTSAEVISSPTPTASTSATVISINNTGFTPQTVTIKAGETVTWVNTDTTTHNVSSAIHPTHLLYPPLNLGTIKTGGSQSLSFPIAGSYKYHDHIYPKLSGTIVVQ